MCNISLTLVFTNVIRVNSIMYLVSPSAELTLVVVS